jgi:Flp pilus assembly protein TadD
MFLRRDAGADASLEGFRLLADMHPESWRARERLGSTLRLAGDDATALEAYESALELLEAAEPAPEIEGHRRRLEDAVAELAKGDSGSG